jgi:kynureninase
MGSPAIPALYAAASGYEIINEIGVEKIRQKNIRQTDYLIQLAEEAGFHVTSPGDSTKRGGTITVAHENASAIAKELVRRRIHYRLPSRCWCSDFSPFLHKR